MSTTDMPKTKEEWAAWHENAERERAAATEVANNRFSTAEARIICRGFAADNDIKWVEAGHCGFGRPCVGFSKNGKWVQYNPVNFESGEYETIVDSGEVDAPEGVEAYHKSDYLCVLKTECETDLAKSLVGLVSAVSGDLEGVKKAEAMPEVEVPKESTNRAIRQMAFWVNALCERGTIEIVEYDTGATGIQALIDEGTKAHAIVVRPR